MKVKISYLNRQLSHKISSRVLSNFFPVVRFWQNSILATHFCHTNELPKSGLTVLIIMRITFVLIYYLINSRTSSIYYVAQFGGGWGSRAQRKYHRVNITKQRNIWGVGVQRTSILMINNIWMTPDAVHLRHRPHIMQHYSRGRGKKLGVTKA